MLLHDDDGQTCFTCSHLESKRRTQTPIFDANSKTLMYKEHTFMKGNGVMLLPNSFDLAIRQKKEFRKASRVLEEKNPKVFTEYWRKANRNAYEMNHPFDIGIIEEIFDVKEGNLTIRVR